MMHKSSCRKLFRIEFPQGGEEQSTMGTGAIKNLRPVLMVSIMFFSFFKKNLPALLRSSGGVERSRQKVLRFPPPSLFLL